VNIGLIILIALIALTFWFWVMIHSKRKYTLLPCKKCGGTGKIFEPFWMAWMCGRRTRAYYKCEYGGDTQRRRHFM
jgi:hypothetical protein